MSKPRYFLFALFIFLIGCSTNPGTITQYQPVDPQQLRPIAAEFITTTTTKGHSPVTSAWRIQRDSQRVELVRLDSQVNEVWSRTSQDLWFYQKVFSEDQQVIEYSPSDLAALGVQPQWLPIALAIDPTVLASLGNGKPGKAIHGYQTQRFKGEFQGADYDVTWIPELALAARVNYSKGEMSSVTEVKMPYPLAESPWPLVNTRLYRLIDYSDLGDMERDPFVMRVQSQLPGGHAHTH